MQIENKPSAFSQFNDGLPLVVKHDDTTISFDVHEDDLLDFAQHLIDIAVDCIRKSEKDTDSIDDILCSAIEAIEKRK